MRVPLIEYRPDCALTSLRFASGFSRLDPSHLNTFWWFVCERQRIWHRRVALDRPSPWTDDRILKSERFTNVYRELDPGTQYVINEILERDESPQDRIFNVMLYRLVGRKETHQAIGFQRVDSFDASTMRHAMRAIRDSGGSPFTAAYMVSGYTGMGSRDKIENVARLFELIASDFESIYQQIQRATTAEQVFHVLRSVSGFGDFLAYQVLVDLTYPLVREAGQPLLPFSQDDWARAGPGARRGIALIRGDSTCSDLETMRWLRDAQTVEFDRLGLDFPWLRDDRGSPVRLTLANIQNCLCEYHKYVKIRDGTGRGRRRFRRGSG